MEWASRCRLVLLVLLGPSALLAAEHADIEITWPCRDHAPFKSLYLGQQMKVSLID